MFLACLFGPSSNFNEAKECYMDWSRLTHNDVTNPDVRQLEEWVTNFDAVPFNCPEILRDSLPENGDE
jgi:hypothetical protein